MATSWNFPTPILFGAGTTRELGPRARSLGASRVFVVTDPGIVRAGLLQPVQDSLKEAGLEHAYFEGISSNPLESEVTAASAVCKEFGADAIVGLGGGSALDVAKILRITTTHEGPLADYAEDAGGDQRVLPDRLPPMIAVPTTAGTGSEVGRSGVATLASTGIKTIFFHPRLMPDVAILDPELTLGLPRHITAATGFDALSHCIEAYCARGDHPMADGIALRGIELIRDHLPRAVDKGGDVEARGAMLQAAMMGAVAFQKGLGTCHSLSHPLSAEHGLHHGLANAICLPAVVAFNRATVPERVARIGQALGELQDPGANCARTLRTLRARLDLPANLGSQGIETRDLPRLAALALQDGCHALNPRSCSEADMLSLYQACMS